MLITPLEIADAHLIEPRVFGDERGAFLEWFRADRLAEALGRQVPIVQANTSVSARGVVRGIHFADVPLGQAKYVTVTRGAIVDYVVDLRVGSPTFGHWQGVELSADNRHAVFLAEGLGHAFVSLADDTSVSYLVTDVFRPEREHAVQPLDSDLGLDYRLPAGELILSAKDEAAPSFDQAHRDGLLPAWQDCQQRYRDLAV
ncbi:MAG: dTDP-4-dehydrorhamnose 3,5-epimerase [Microcella sp.]|uniref:dTDP-4-dehydrorhamnose 3,5-epimerase n=1 Tax=Microcella sp. TaxID=1913979 RepID=UPI003314D2EE